MQVEHDTRYNIASSLLLSLSLSKKECVLSTHVPSLIVLETSHAILNDTTEFHPTNMTFKQSVSLNLCETDILIDGQKANYFTYAMPHN